VLFAAVLVASVALGAYAFYAQASTGDGAAAGLFGLWLPWQTKARLTATPTKTPASGLTPTLTATPLPKLPTHTPTATPTAPTTTVVAGQAAAQAVAAAATSTPRPPLPEDLVRVAKEYGLDPADRLLVIDQNQQRMHVVEDGYEARTLPVSTGNPDDYFRTPAWVGTVGEYWGSFSARGVWGDDAWYLFTLEGGGTILIHSAPYVLEDGVRVYKDLDALGLYPASRGCIRLLPEDARWFSEWQPEGVPIVILPWDGGTSQQG